MASQNPTPYSGKVYALIGVGLAAIMAGYQFATQTPPEGAISMTMPVTFGVIAVACFAGAFMLARKPKQG